MKSGRVLSAVGAGQVSAFAVWLGRTTPVPQLAGSGEGAVTAAVGAGAPVSSAALAGPTLRAASRTAAAAIINPSRFLRIAFSFLRESPAWKTSDETPEREAPNRKVRPAWKEGTRERPPRSRRARLPWEAPAIQLGPPRLGQGLFRRVRRVRVFR